MSLGQLKFTTRNNGVITEYTVHHEPAKVVTINRTAKTTTIIGLLYPIGNLTILATVNGEYIPVKIREIGFRLVLDVVNGCNIEFMFLDDRRITYTSRDLNIDWSANKENIVIENMGMFTGSHGDQSTNGKTPASERMARHLGKRDTTEKLNTFSFIYNGKEYYTVGARFSSHGITIRKCDEIGVYYVGDILFNESVIVGDTAMRHVQFNIILKDGNMERQADPMVTENNVSFTFFDINRFPRHYVSSCITLTPAQAEHITNHISRHLTEYGLPLIPLNVHKYRVIK